MLCTLFFILLKKLNKKYSLYDKIKKSGFLWGLKVFLIWLIFSLLSIKVISQERQLTGAFESVIMFYKPLQNRKT